MSAAPTFDDIFAVMSAASIGDAAARVALPEDPRLDHLPTRFAIALNLLLDDLALRGLERQRLESQLRQAQKMEAVGRLAGGVAHDFNNLLTVITSYASFLANDLPPADPRRKDVEEIEGAARRAAALTHQLLAYSRQQVLQPQSVDLNRVVSDMSRLLERLIGEDIELLSRLQPDLGMVYADPGQLEQVVMNLALNGRDAMPEGGRLLIETANVELGEDFAHRFNDARVGAHVMLAVSDTGTGMDPETQALVFEPFFTTKEAGKGTGLGLATVYGIVRQSGGSIWVYSEPGQGTTFKVYLPQHVAEVPDQPAPLDRPSAKVRGGVVLLVEDEAEVRRVARRILTTQGFAVREAANGSEALKILAEGGHGIDLVISDIVMPEMSGQSLASEMARHFPATRIILMSGYTKGMLGRSDVLPEGVRFVEKPFTPASLLVAVDAVLAR